MEVTRLRDTPILTFMNKLDREVRDPMEVMDEVERELNIMCAPITWPIGCGKSFKGSTTSTRTRPICIRAVRATPSRRSGGQGVEQPELDAAIGEDLAAQLRGELELVQGASPEFDHDAFIAGEMTPVFFGTALGNFGVDHMLDGLTDWAPSPMPRKAESREVAATEEKFPASCSRSRRTWIRNTATVSRLCVSCQAPIPRA